MPSPNLTLPAGTQVVTKNAIWDEMGQMVCPAGAVGIILASPADHRSPYLVRFNNGFETHLVRHQLLIRKHFQQDGITRTGQVALADTCLPVEPDYQKANDFLVQARRRAACG